MMNRIRFGTITYEQWKTIDKTTRVRDVRSQRELEVVDKGVMLYDAKTPGIKNVFYLTTKPPGLPRSSERTHRAQNIDEKWVIPSLDLLG
jgi:hypothetical protein